MDIRRSHENTLVLKRVYISFELLPDIAHLDFLRPRSSTSSPDAVPTVSLGVAVDFEFQAHGFFHRARESCNSPA